ncbi:hypothetical protein Tco_0464135 [Tanacetum coccineum]
MVTTTTEYIVMGEVKLFSSVNNLRVILSAEGFSIQKVVYLGGLWVMFELPSANSKSKFLAHADDIHEEGEFIQIGEEGLEKPIHQTNVEEESDIEAVSETFFGDQCRRTDEENIQKKKESGSILEILEEMISVGQTMGFSMEGSIKDMERIIDLKGADDHGADEMTWNSINLNDSNAMVRFKKKLQALKKVIRLWIGNYKRNQMNQLLKTIHEYPLVETRKRCQLAVKGVKIDCEWVDDSLVKCKDEFSVIFRFSFLDPRNPSWFFIGEWSRGNLTGIMHTLRCFSLLSGLSINLKKSQLLGVVPKAVLKSMESIRRNFLNGIRDGEKKIAWGLLLSGFAASSVSRSIVEARSFMLYMAPTQVMRNRKENEVPLVHRQLARDQRMTIIR